MNKSPTNGCPSAEDFNQDIQMTITEGVNTEGKKIVTLSYTVLNADEEGVQFDPCCPPYCNLEPYEIEVEDEEKRHFVMQNPKFMGPIKEVRIMI